MTKCVDEVGSLHYATNTLGTGICFLFLCLVGLAPTVAATGGSGGLGSAARNTWLNGYGYGYDNRKSID